MTRDRKLIELVLRRFAVYQDDDELVDCLERFTKSPEYARFCEENAISEVTKESLIAAYKDGFDSATETLICANKMVQSSKYKNPPKT